MKIAEINVSYSTNQIDKIKLTNSKEVFNFIISKWNLNIIEFQEESKIILVNRANFVIGIHDLSKGGISGTVVDIRIILGVALKCNASSIILVHNHPSGKLEASEPDKAITKRLKQACNLLELVLLDHLIISRYEYFSFADDGIL